MTDDEAEAFLDSLKLSDAPKLQRQIAMGQLNQRQRELARDWLSHQQIRDSSQTARSAKNAAWAAAIAATVAAIATAISAYLVYFHPPS